MIKRTDSFQSKKIVLSALFLFGLGLMTQAQDVTVAFGGADADPYIEGGYEFANLVGDPAVDFADFNLENTEAVTITRTGGLTFKLNAIDINVDNGTGVRFQAFLSSIQQGSDFDVLVAGPQLAVALPTDFENVDEIRVTNLGGGFSVFLDNADFDAAVVAVAPMTYTVMNNNDAGAGSLRQAILDANANTPADDVIDFASAFAPIVLGSDLPTIDDNLTVNGFGTDDIFIDGANAFSVFQVNAGVNFSINNLTIQNGDANAGTVNGGGIAHYGGTLTIDNVIFNNNRGGTGGTAAGGGLYIDAAATGTTLISNSYFEDNNNTGGSNSGGGVYFDGSGGATCTIENSTFYNNSAGNGGAIFVENGTARLLYCSVSGNSASGSGGGVLLNSASALMYVNYSIVIGNTGGDLDAGPGVFNGDNPVTGPVDNTANVGVASGVFNNGTGLTDGTTDFTIPGVPTDNGGAGLTFVVSGAEAVNIAEAGTISTDQTGISRGAGSLTIGALEINENPVTTLSASFSTAENSAIAFAPSIVDGDGDNLSVTLTTAYNGDFGNNDGFFNLDGTSGATTGGDGTNTATISGTLSQVNAELALIEFEATNAGPRQVTLAVNDGWTGVGGNGTDSDNSAAGVTGTYLLSVLTDAVTPAVGSLRAAMNDANSVGGFNIIDASGLGANQTITLTAGLPVITNGLTINGPVASGLTIDGNGFSILQMSGVDNKTVNDLRLTGGNFANGGAVSITGGANHSFNRIHFDGNTASASGGALYTNNGFFVVRRSLFTGNSAPIGGAINNAASVNIRAENSTFSGNMSTAGDGGAIRSSNSGGIDLDHVTISGNTSSTNIGEGISAIAGPITLNYSIVYGNGSDDINITGTGSMDAETTDNIVGTSTGTAIANAGSVIATDPTLGALALNFAGMTQTMTVGAAAIDAATGSTETVDQIGQTRPIKGDRDLGALEMQNTVPTATDFTMAFGVEAIGPIVEADLGYNDTDGDAFVSIEIVTLPGAGTLFLDLNDNSTDDGGGETIAATDVITSANLALNRLKYEATSAAGSSSFTFTVNDGFDDSTPANTATLYSVENALDFDGTDDFIVIADDPAFDFDRTDPFTIEFWMNIDNIGADMTIIDKYIARGYLARIQSTGELQVVLGIGAGDIFSMTTGVLSTSTWYHVAWVYDGSSNETGVTLYLNGVETSLTNAGNATLSGTVSGNGGPLSIGYQDTGGTQYFDGQIDEVRIWSTARTGPNVRALAADRYPNPAADGNLVLYNNFNQGVPAGDNTLVGTAVDLSSNGFVGTLNNFDIDGTNTGGTLSNWIGSTAFASPGATTPNMVVTQSSTVYPDAGAAYDYGAQTLASNTDAIFTITNEGLSDLTLSALPTLNDGTNYSIQSGYAASTVVGAGQTQALTVRYTPTTAATHNDYVIMTSDDAGTPYDLNLTGTGQNLVGITTATWLDSDFDGDIDQLQLDFSETVDITDGGAGADGFPAIVISGGTITIDNVDLSGAAFDAITSLTLNVSGGTGTADPGVTVTYSDIATNTVASIVGGQEVADGTVAASYVDGAPPVLVSAITQDNNGNGFIDEIFVTMSEDIDAATLDETANPTVTDDFSLAGYAITSVTPLAGTGVDDDELVIAITEGGVVTPDTDSTPQVDLVASAFDDLATAPNASLVYSAAATDAAGPAIVSAVTNDTDGNGEIDEILVTFSEDIDATTLDETANPNVTDDFSITGFNILSVTPVAGTGVNDDEVIIVIDESGSPDTGDTPQVDLTVGTISDGIEPTFNPVYSANATDGAAPVFVSATAVDANNAFVDITFSEGLYTVGGGPVLVSDFETFNLVTVSTVTIENIFDGADGVSPLAGGENEIRFEISTSVNGVSGTSFEIRPIDNSPFTAGDFDNLFTGHVNEASGTLNLNTPTFITFSAEIAPDNSYVILTFSEAVDRDGDGGQELRYRNNREVYTTSLMPNGGNASAMSISDANLVSSTGTAQNSNTVWRLNIASVTGGATSTGDETFLIGPPNDSGVLGVTSSSSNGLEILASDGSGSVPRGTTFTVSLADRVANDFANATAAVYDNNADGNIDRLTITFDDAIEDVTFSEADFTFGTYTFSAFSATDTSPGDPGTANDNAVTLLITDYEGTGVSDNLVFGAGTLRDDARLTIYQGNGATMGNLFLNTPGATGITVDDLAPPRMIVSEPIITQDLSGHPLDPGGSRDGKIDNILISFTEPIANADPSDFTIGGYAVSGVTSVGNDVNVGLTQGGTFDTDAAPLVTITSTADAFEDAGGNDFAGASQTATDRVGPFAQVQDDDNDADADGYFDDYPNSNFGSLEVNIQGTVDPTASLVFVQVDGDASVSIPSAGNWDVTLNVSDVGDYDVEITTFDGNGNTGLDAFHALSNLPLDEINISSSNTVLITPFSAPTVCEDNFISLGTLVITEQDDANFGVQGNAPGTGDDTFMMLQLPTGFFFDTSIDPNSGLSATGGDVTAYANYVGNAILQLNFEVPTTDFPDVLTVAGLMVTATDESALDGTPVDIVRFAGDANIFGASTNGQVFGSVAPFDTPDPITALGVSQPVRRRINNPISFNVATGTSINWYDVDGNLIYNGATPTEADFAENTFVDHDGGGIIFTVGETVIGQTFGATGIVVSDNGTTLEINTVNGYFAVGEEIIGDVSAVGGVSAIVVNSGFDISVPGLYTFYVADDNGNCESEWTQFKVLLTSDDDPTTASLTHGGISTDFTLSEIVTGGTSGATGQLSSKSGTTLELVNVTGDFVVGEVISGGTSGSSQTILSEQVDNSFINRTYNDTDAVDDIYITNPDGHTVTVTSSGAGLSIPDGTANPLLLQFNPATAGVGTYNVTYNIVNNTTGISANIIRTWVIQSAADLFNPVPATEYCPDDGATTFTVNNVFDATWGNLPYLEWVEFYGLRYSGYNYMDGQDLHDGVPNYPITGSYQFDFDPSSDFSVPDGDFENVYFYSYITDSDGNDRIGAEEYFIIYGNPTVSIGGLSTDDQFCSDEGQVQILRTVDYVSSVNTSDPANPIASLDSEPNDDPITNGYTLRRWNGASYVFLANITTDYFDPADPDQDTNLGEVNDLGMFQIYYETEGLGPEGCIGSTTINVQVSEQPDLLTLDATTQASGGSIGFVNTDEYLLEYCIGDALTSLDVNVDFANVYYNYNRVGTINYTLIGVLPTFLVGDRVVGQTNGTKAIVTSDFLGNMAIESITGVDFNVGEILIGDNGAQGTINSYTETTTFFVAGETITGLTSGNTATIESFTEGNVELSGISGPFTVGEIISGGTSGTVKTVTLYRPDVTWYDADTDTDIFASSVSSVTPFQAGLNVSGSLLTAAETVEIWISTTSPTGCESLRRKVTLTVHPDADLPVVDVDDWPSEVTTGSLVNLDFCIPRGGEVSPSNTVTADRIVFDPLIAGEEEYAVRVEYHGLNSSSAWRDYIKFIDLTTPMAGTFRLGERVDGSSSGAFGYVQSVSSSLITIRQIFTDPTTDFTVAEVITGQLSGATATVNAYSDTRIYTSEEIPSFALRQISYVNGSSNAGFLSGESVTAPSGATGTIYYPYSSGFLFLYKTNDIDFVGGEIATGSSSGATMTVSSFVQGADGHPKAKYEVSKISNISMDPASVFEGCEGPIVEVQTHGWLLPNEPSDESMSGGSLEIHASEGEALGNIGHSFTDGTDFYWWYEEAGLINQIGTDSLFNGQSMTQTLLSAAKNDANKQLEVGGSPVVVQDRGDDGANDVYTYYLTKSDHIVTSNGFDGCESASGSQVTLTVHAKQDQPIVESDNLLSINGLSDFNDINNDGDPGNGDDNGVEHYYSLCTDQVFGENDLQFDVTNTAGFAPSRMAVLSYGSPIGTISLGDIVEGQTSGATGEIIGNASGVLYVEYVTGTFVNGEQVSNESASSVVLNSPIQHQDQTIWFSFFDLTGGPFVALETVTGSQSGATGQILAVGPNLILRNVVGIFHAGESIVGGTSAASAVLDFVGNETRKYKWYSYNNGTQIRGSLLYEGAHADFTSLELSSISSSAQRYFELVAVTDLDDASGTTFEGVESESTLIRVEISDQDALTFEDDNGDPVDTEFCVDEGVMITINLQAGGVDVADPSTELAYDINSFLLSNYTGDFSDTPDVIVSGVGNPTIDIDALHLATDASAVSVGGQSTIHELVMFYTDPVTNCTGQAVHTFTVHSEPDVAVVYDDDDDSATPSIDVDGLVMCYDDDPITLDGISNEVSVVVNLTAGTFTVGETLTGPSGTGTIVSIVSNTVPPPLVLLLVNDIVGEFADNDAVSDTGGSGTAVVVGSNTLSENTGVFAGAGLPGPGNNNKVQFDPAEAHGTGPTDPFNTPSSHVITFTYTDAENCTRTVNQTITVNPRPYAVGTVDVDQVQFNSRCESGTVDAFVEFYDPADPGNTILTDYSGFSFTWEVNGGTPVDLAISGNGATFTTVGEDMNIVVTVTNNATGCSVVLDEDHTKDPLPILAFTTIFDLEDFCYDETDFILDVTADLDGDGAGATQSISGALDVDDIVYSINSYTRANYLSLIGGTPTAADRTQNGMDANPTIDFDEWHTNAAVGGTILDLPNRETYHLISIQYTNPSTGCIGTTENWIVIHPNPNVTFLANAEDVEDGGFEGSFDSFCYSDVNVELEAIFADLTTLVDPSATISFSGNGVSSTGTGTAVFDPSAAHDVTHGAGSDFEAQSTHTITLDYTDVFGCSYQVTQDLFVNPTPDFTNTAGNRVEFNQICGFEDPEVFVRLNVPGTATPITDYTGYLFDWTVDGNYIGQTTGTTGNNNTFSTANESFTISVLVTSPSACTNTFTEIHTKTTVPEVSFELITDQENFCHNDTQFALDIHAVTDPDVSPSRVSVETDLGEESNIEYAILVNGTTDTLQVMGVQQFGIGNPMLNFSDWHTAAGGANVALPGNQTSHDILIRYQSGSTGCFGTTIATINVHPDPDVTFAVNNQDVSDTDFDDNVGTDYDEFCYDDLPIDLVGYFSDVDLTTDPVTESSFLNFAQGSASFSGPGVSTTGLGEAIFDPAEAHGADPHAAQSSHLITFDYTDEFGCSHSVSQTLFVNPQPDPIEVAGTNPGGDQIQFDAICSESTISAFVELAGVTDYSGYTFVWGLPGDASGEVQNLNTITYESTVENSAANKIFDIGVTVTSNLTGCSIVIDETHAQQTLPTLSFDNVMAGETFCANDPSDPEGMNVAMVMSTNGGVIDSQISGDADTNIEFLSYVITSSPNDFDDINVADDTGADGDGVGAPFIDLALWHDLANNGVADDDLVGGVETTHTIEMTYVDNHFNMYQDGTTGCVITESITITIYPDPDITFSIAGNDDDNVTFCYDDGNVSLIGLFAGGANLANSEGGVFSGDGVSGTSSNITTFNTSDAHDAFHGGGSHPFDSKSSNAITFTYTDENGCTNEITKTIIISPRPDVPGSQINFDSACLGFDTEASVTVYQPGTTTEVADYTGYVFTWVTDQGTFTTGDPEVNGNSVIVPADGDNINVTLSVTIQSPIDGGDGSGGCTVSITDTETQGFPPVPSFTYVGISENSPLGLDVYFQENDAQLVDTDVTYLEFTMTGITGTTIVTPTIRTTNDLSPINVMGLTAGTYQAQVTMGTDKGCLIPGDLRVITILPTFDLGDPITGGGYTESFEDDNGGWYIETVSEDGKTDDRVTSWQRTSLTIGTFNDDIESFDGGMIVTNAEADGTSYFGGEVSFVYSPSLDYSQYANPALSFNYIRDFDSNRDGVVVQVSDDDGRTWTTLGDNNINSGINWYTDQGISAGPGAGIGRSPEAGINDDLVGFADVDLDESESPTPVWKEARHQLTEGDYTNSNIRYRFALAAITGDKIETDTRSNNADGFAFDNFEVYEINKLLLVEQFSSTLSAQSKANETFINDGGVDQHDIDWEQGTQGIWINYFTDMENSGSEVDPLNASNKVDPATRATYYGVSDIPDTRIAGEDVPYDLDDTPEDFGNGFNAISLRDADFNVYKDHPTEADGIVINSSDADVLSVSVTFTAIIDDPVDEVELGFFFAVVEKEKTVTSGVYSNEIVRYPLRVLLPGPEGAYYRGGLVNGQEFNYDMNWTISGVDDPDNLRVIVFAQYYDHPNPSKVGGVEQAAWIDAEGLGKTNSVVGLEDLLTNDVLELYPNPADDKVTMILADAPMKPVLWRVSDQSGKQVMTGRIERGIKEVTIDTDDLPSGLYIIQIFNDQNSWIPKKVIISH